MKYRRLLNVRCRVLFAAVFAAAIFNACRKESPASNLTGTTPIASDGSAPKSFLALGDSYTIGSSVSIEERFPVQTRTKLLQAGVKINAPNIIAVSGWTTGSLLFSLNQSPPANNYDVVTLLIGVNNQYQGRTQQEYRVEFTSLLEKAINYASGRKNRVFVLSIPDYSVTAFAQNSDTARISQEIDAFNVINKQITMAAGVTYLDITGISREARLDPSLIAGDGLHPSGKQYSRWASLLSPLIQAAL